MRNKIGTVRKPPVSIITNRAIQEYLQTCNKGTDSYELAKLKINRDYALGQVVSIIGKEEDGVCLIQYYDIFMKCNNTIVTKIFRSNKLKKRMNKRFGEFRRNERKYNNFNKKHNL